jgi:hypothetical protein
MEGSIRRSGSDTFSSARQEPEVLEQTIHELRRRIDVWRA